MTIPHRWLTAPSYGDGDNVWGGQNDYAIYGQGRVPVRELFVNRYNARFFGARGDGRNDDAIPLRAALEAIRLAGGGTLHIPAGVYLLNSLVANPENGAFLAALISGGNTRIVGDGPGATILKLGNTMPNQARMLYNYHISSGGDENIVLENLTFDGNAAGQSGAVDAQYGAVFTRVRGLRVHNCRFKDVFGTTAGGNGPNGTTGEGFATSVGNSSDVEYVNCEALASSAATSSGFSANSSNTIRYLGCWAHDLGIGNGFTHNTCAHVKHMSCHSYKNAQYGFNSESSADISYEGCTAGGTSANASTYPFAALTALGNSNSGFVMNGSSSCWYIGCEGVGNVSGHGLWMTTNTGPTHIVGGQYTGNGQWGLNCNTPSQIRVTGRPLLTGNTTAKIRIPGVNVDPDTTLPAPAVPASTTPLTNPFPFACSVSVIGGTVTVIAIDGTATGATAGQVRVPAAGTITLTYSAAPSWQWWTD